MKTMITEKNEHSWCVNAFHGMSANNDGSTKMCCMVSKEYRRMSNIDYSIGKMSIQENFNNPVVQKIRDNLSNGIKDNACNSCWKEEESGRKSKRIRDNERYLHELKWQNRMPYEGLAKLELNLGNTCNIKCRTCHPTISSQWMKEEYDLDHSSSMTYKKYSVMLKPYHQQYDDDSSFWEDLINNLSTIKQFDFYGGEPFLSKKMWEVLKICVDRGYAKNIELHYNTNGTTWPKEIELWKNFKSVNLSFSIDGIADQFEYMRHLAIWDEVCVNMGKALDFKKTYGNLSLSWCITLSTANIYYLPEILNEYYKNFTDFGLYLNLVHGPEHFNISYIPSKIKEKIISKLETVNKDYVHAWNQLPGIIGFIKQGTPNLTIWNIFLEKIKKHDVYRKQDFFVTFKEFGDIINDSILE
jgi:organic radical activating enzyme